jgi:hypothetical protein
VKLMIWRRFLRHHHSSDAAALTNVVGLVATSPSSPDRFTLARIEHERDSDTPSPSLVIPVTNVPSYVRRFWESA